VKSAVSTEICSAVARAEKKVAMKVVWKEFLTAENSAVDSVVDAAVAWESKKVGEMADCSAEMLASGWDYERVDLSAGLSEICSVA
jgi:hypothetical protein